jgi:hypothetical protein
MESPKSTLPPYFLSAAASTTFVLSPLNSLKCELIPSHHFRLACNISHCLSSSPLAQYHFEYAWGVLRVRSELGDDADGTTNPALGSVGEKDGIRAGGEWGIRVDTYGLIYPSALCKREKRKRTYAFRRCCFQCFGTWSNVVPNFLIY